MKVKNSNYFERKVIFMNNERLTWEQIKEKYPNQNVGLVDIETEENSRLVKTTIVKYTSNNTSDEDLQLRAILGEICLVHTKLDKKPVKPEPIIHAFTQF